MDTLKSDVVFAVRTLGRARGFAVAAILTLALGIGSNTAMFTAVNAVLLRPLPFPNPDRLMSVVALNTRHGTPALSALSYPDYVDYRVGNRTFDDMASYYPNYLGFSGRGEAMMLRGAVVGAGLFRILGVQPRMGRAFLPEEDQPGHRVAVISDALWRTRFNSDRGVAGESLDLDGKAYTIVGVAPVGFQFPIQSKPTDIWVTTALDFETTAPGDKPVGTQRGAHFLAAIGRLKAGVTREQAETDLKAVASSLTSRYPDTNTNTAVRVESFLTNLVGDTRTLLLIMLAAVGCVLLIACANVASLVLARSSRRSREIAIRAALGAKRVRIARQLITEAIVLAIPGALLGGAAASWGASALARLYPENLPRIAEVGLDWRVLLFTIGLALASAILFGLAPALQTSRPNLKEPMQEGGRGSVGSAQHTRLRSGLVITETAIGVMLLIGAGMLIRSLNRLSHVDLGFNPEHLLTASFGISQTRYNADQQDRFYTELLTRIRALPGVSAAGGTQQLPLSGNDWDMSFDIVKRRLPRNQQPVAGFYNVTSGFFEAMQIPLVKGRFFDQRDTRMGTPVTIVNQAFAERYFPNEDPVGNTIEVAAGEGPSRKRWNIREIVGVVGNTRSSDLSKAPAPAYFVPQPQLIWGPPTLIVRTSGDPQAAASAVRNVLASMDRDAPLFDIKTMEDYLALDLGRARFQTMLLGIFAGIALMLTAVGLYGVVAYTVAQRTHEIGIRMALGASRAGVLRMVLSRALLLTVTGIGVGLVGAASLARLIASLLYGIQPRDPATYITVCVTLGVVALLAGCIPAIRASRIDPMAALRYE